jgi:uncharacterized protein
MADTAITELKRIFISRLDTLDHILDVGEAHVADIDAALAERLAPDMFPLGTQVAFACNQPRGFAQWCAGQPVSNLDPEVQRIAVARGHIRDTRAMVAAIDADDARLDETKRTGLGPGVYCETSARLYVSDYLLPNFYFHISITYAILRRLGVPLGKADYMRFLMPHVRKDAGTGPAS